jgi:hypothetical protein
MLLGLVCKITTFILLTYKYEVVTSKVKNSIVDIRVSSLLPTLKLELHVYFSWKFSLNVVRF